MSNNPICEKAVKAFNYVVLKEEERKVKVLRQFTIKVFVQPSDSQQVTDMSAIVGSVGGSLSRILMSLLSSNTQDNLYER